MRADTYAALERVLGDPNRTPLAVLELLVRIEYEERQSHIKHEERQARDPSRANGHASSVEHVGKVAIDRRAMRVWVDGVEMLDLTPTETRLLLLFAEREGECLTRDDLFMATNPNNRKRQIHQTESEEIEARTRVVAVHIGRLRRKLSRDWIVTVPGFGYRFEPS